jgi:hemoglobin-like flavoprotein
MRKIKDLLFGGPAEAEEITVAPDLTPGPKAPEPTWRTPDPDDTTQVGPRARFERRGREVVAEPLPAGEQVASGPHADPYDSMKGGVSDAKEWELPTTANTRITEPLPSAGHRASPVNDPNPITDSGVHFIAAPLADDESETCEHCGGKVPTDHELLMQVKEWVAPAGPQAMHRFYELLFTVDPNLRELFPARIETQEEKLLTAIVALLDLFNAGEAQMEKLNSTLASFGRKHTRFDPAATIEEYAAVKGVLFQVFGELLGSKLTPRHINVLTRAYEYAAGMMLASQATAKLTGAGRRRRTV